MIIHPFKPQLNNKPVGQVKDPDGTPLFLNMVDSVKEKGQGFVPYKWPKPGLEKPVDKVYFVQLFTSWNWIIGSGIYIDNIYAEQRNLLLLLSLLAVAMGFFVYY